MRLSVPMDEMALERFMCALLRKAGMFPKVGLNGKTVSKHPPHRQPINRQAILINEWLRLVGMDNCKYNGFRPLARAGCREPPPDRVREAIRYLEKRPGTPARSDQVPVPWPWNGWVIGAGMRPMRLERVQDRSGHPIMSQATGVPRVPSKRNARDADVPLNQGQSSAVQFVPRVQPVQKRGAP